jgi:DNA polymerase-3 subunit chi
MSEVLFYQLDRKPLEAVLPELLEKCVERRWHTVVQLGSEERVAALDAHLWTYRDDGFLPHGTARDGHAERQPIYLTAGGDNPNHATVRFLADGVPLADPAPYDRLILIFDGHDEEALAAARQAWSAVRQAGHQATYWQQTERGGWEKKG